jgi:hypothetical protein
MLPTILSAVTQSLQLVDVAVETKNAIVRETKAAAISMAGVGAGVALILSGAVLGCATGLGAVKASCFIEADIGTSLGMGLFVATLCGLRLKQANDRLNAIKDTLTARAAREAAARLASTGVDMAMSGAASAQEFARSAAAQAANLANRIFQRGDKNTASEAGKTETREDA